MYVIINGDPFGGFSITGPFDSVDEATTWAEDAGNLGSWWVTELEAPDTDN
jgi:hypothetical protein